MDPLFNETCHLTRRKILHAADIHLDSPLQKLDTYENAPADAIREASRLALQNMTQLAIEQDVDLVVIAGDLYDGDWPDQNTGLFFVRQAAELVQAGIPIVVIRGNHDAANKMTSSLPLPRNPDGSTILLSESKVDSRVFEDLGIAVHGRSYRKRAETGDLAKSYPAPHSGLFNLGLLHTGLSGLEGHDPYAPCTPQQLADKQYDYWALGHIHKRGEHQVKGAAPVVFSGNVQGRHIRESGAKGCVLVEVDDRNQCELTFHPLDVVRWELCRLKGQEIQHPDEVCDLFQQWLDAATERADDRLLIPRVRIEGLCQAHDRLVRAQTSLEHDLRAIAVAHGSAKVWLERLKVRTTPSDESRKTNFPNDALEGPLESVRAVASELTQDSDTARDWVQSQLGALLKKLPREMTGNDAVLNLDDSVQVERLVNEAVAELQGRFHQTSSTKASKEDARETLF